MAITTKTVTGTIVIPGTTTGIRAKVTATPMTNAQALTFAIDDIISWGPVVGHTDAAGLLTSSFKIPTSSDQQAVLVWRFVAEPIDKHAGLPRAWTMGHYEIEGTGEVNLADLVDVDVDAYNPTTLVTMQEYVALTETARAETEAARDATVDISGIAIDDDIVEVLVKGTAGAGPKTRAAIQDTLAPLRRTSGHRLPDGTRIAHRGAMGHAPENTRASFAYAGRRGATACEFDIRTTSDGVPIILHDATVDAMTAGTGAVNAKTLATVRGLTIDAGTNIAKYPGQIIPTLAEAIAECAKYDMAPVLDMKAAGDWEDVAAVVRASGAEAAATIIVDSALAADVRAAFPNTSLFLYIDPTSTAAAITAAQDVEAEGIAYTKATWTTVMADAVHAAGLRTMAQAFFTFADIAAYADRIDLFICEAGAL